MTGVPKDTARNGRGSHPCPARIKVAEPTLALPGTPRRRRERARRPAHPRAPSALSTEFISKPEYEVILFTLEQTQS